MAKSTCRLPLVEVGKFGLVAKLYSNSSLLTGSVLPLSSLSVCISHRLGNPGTFFGSGVTADVCCGAGNDLRLTSASIFTGVANLSFTPCMKFSSLTSLALRGLIPKAAITLSADNSLLPELGLSIVSTIP